MTDKTVTRMVARVDDTRCDGCRICLPSCKHGALLWIKGDNELLIDPWACNACGSCITTCPTSALSIRSQNEIEINT